MDTIQYSFDDLYIIWVAMHNQSAWLTRLSNRMGLSQSDEDTLVGIDSAWQSKTKGFEYKHNEQAKKMDNGFVADYAKDNAEWMKERRLEYINGKIESISNDMQSDAETYNKMLETDSPIFDRLLHRACSTLANKKDPRTKYLWERSVLRSDNKDKMLTDAKIGRARNHPLESLVEPVRGYILCPLHKDKKPSMWVKGGFGYCFTCHGSLDSIGYLMTVKGMNFRDAVEALQ